MRKVTSCERTTRRIHRWVALICAAASTLAPAISAQDETGIPTIRVEAHEVLIPLSVSAMVQDGHLIGYISTQHLSVQHFQGGTSAPHLKAQDFHLFEDGKEQAIGKAMLMHLPMMPILQDNLSYQGHRARTPRGLWATLNDRASLTYYPPIYMIAYRPPESPEGSCHSITIKVSSKDETGNRMTIAEDGPFLVGNEFAQAKAMVDRRELILHYRKQYCNVPHAATDPLFGTSESVRLESVLSDKGSDKNNIYLKAMDFFNESQGSRVYVVLDFSQSSTRRGSPEFQIALLGMFKRPDGTLMDRFSDSVIEGLHSEDYALFSSFYNRDHSYNHYETDADLPPGDYNLRVAIDFGGALRRAEVPVHVRAPEKNLAVSGIALCRRYFMHDQPLQGPQPPPDGIPTLPFELTPLVSKGIEFTPTGDTRFKKKDPLAAYFEVYEPLLAGGGNVHVQFEIRIVDAKTGEVKSDSGFRPADGYVNPGKMIIPISQKVAIEELTPGEYQVQVRAKDSAGNSTDWRTTSFTRE